MTTITATSNVAITLMYMLTPWRWKKASRVRARPDPAGRNQQFKTYRDGGPAQDVHKDRNWIGYTLASPTQPHLVIFRHVGPAERVEQPLFGLDLRGGKPWAIRPKKIPGEKLQSIHWQADGESIAFHAQRNDEHFVASIRYDNQQPREIPLRESPGHFHCNSLDLIAADHGAGLCFPPDDDNRSTAGSTLAGGAPCRAMVGRSG